MTVAERTPLVVMQDINVAFGGVHAVRDATIDLYAGEVIGLVGGNGARHGNDIADARRPAVGDLRFPRGSAVYVLPMHDASTHQAPSCSCIYVHALLTSSARL